MPRAMRRIRTLCPMAISLAFARGAGMAFHICWPISAQRGAVVRRGFQACRTSRLSAAGERQVTLSGVVGTDAGTTSFGTAALTQDATFSVCVAGPTKARRLDRPIGENATSVSGILTLRAQAHPALPWPSW